MLQQGVNGVFLQGGVTAYVGVGAVHVGAGELAGAAAGVEHVQFVADVAHYFRVVFHVNNAGVEDGDGFAVFIHRCLFHNVEVAGEALDLVNLR